MTTLGERIKNLRAERELQQRQLAEKADLTPSMLCLDAPEFIGTFWGAIKIGAVPIPTNTLMRTADYLYFLNDSRAKVAVVSAALLAEVGPALTEARHLKHVLVAGGAPGPYMLVLIRPAPMGWGAGATK